MLFQLFGLAVLFFFYGVYLGKMMIQRKKGIQTDQIAKGRKKGKLFWVEATMKAATYTVVIVEVVSLLFRINWAPVWLRYLGAAIAGLGAACFAVSVCTMKDSWRAGIPDKDKTEIVTKGIYSVSRNPAFLGFDLTYIGFLFMFFNPVLIVFTAFAVVMLHMQILQEEPFLEKTFGQDYIEYKSRVRRYLGRK